MSGLELRPGRAGDLRAAFDLGEAAWDESRGGRRSAEDLKRQWRRERPLIEFIDAQADGHFVVCEDGDELAGYARVARFGSMDELSELWVAPAHAGRGVGKALLEACWPERPNRELGRVALGAGLPADLGLFTEFGIMPAGGHWQLRQRAEEYVERRSRELDSAEPPVHALTADRAVGEWNRLEPGAVGHERPLLHEFFGRTRTCLAIMDAGRDEAARSAG